MRLVVRPTDLVRLKALATAATAAKPRCHANVINGMEMKFSKVILAAMTGLLLHAVCFVALLFGVLGMVEVVGAGSRAAVVASIFWVGIFGSLAALLTAGFLQTIVPDINSNVRRLACVAAIAFLHWLLVCVVPAGLARHYGPILVVGPVSLAVLALFVLPMSILCVRIGSVWTGPKQCS